MSRKEIGSLLSTIFSEQGIVNIILGFEDLELDLLRTIVNPLEHALVPVKRRCPFCSEGGRSGLFNMRAFFDPEFPDYEPIFTICSNFHVAFPLSNFCYIDIAIARIEFEDRGAKTVPITNQDCKMKLCDILSRLSENIHSPK